MTLKKCSLLSLFMLFIFLCGCTGYREIDRGYLVTAIGFSSQNGKANIYIEALSSSDVIDKPSERVVLTGEGINFEKAFENLKTYLVKPLYFEQLGTAVFENGDVTGLEFLRKLPNINPGIYLVSTDDIKTLFENEAINGTLGYDAITLIKTQQSGSAKVTNRLYLSQKENFTLPIVNFSDEKLTLINSGDKK